LTDPHTLVDRLVTELPAWLPARRWFAGKDRPITSVRNLVTTVLLSGDPMLLHVVVEVAQSDRAERYQLLIGSRTHLPEHLGSSWIGTFDGLPCYEATADADLTCHLLDMIIDESRTGPIAFEHEPDVETGRRAARPADHVRAEQHSLVYGNQYILKLFRKLSPGLNPDLRLHRALWEVGCQHIARPLGAITADESTTLAMLQQFLPDAVDGWAMATTSVRDLMAVWTVRPTRRAATSPVRPTASGRPWRPCTPISSGRWASRRWTRTNSTAPCGPCWPGWRRSPRWSRTGRVRSRAARRVRAGA